MTMTSSAPTDSDSIEVKATSAILSAAAFWIGTECQIVNDMFMACKRKSNDPADCAEAGLAVTHCVNNLFKKIGKECKSEFERYWKCLDMNNQMFMYCREEEEPFTQCALIKLGLKKELWKGRGPEDGIKSVGDLPAKDSIPYKLHIFQHKRS